MAANRYSIRSILLCSLILVLWAVAIPGWAESSSVLEKDREELYRFLLAPPDTSSPRATMESFISNMDSAYAYVQEARLKEEHADTVFFHSAEVKPLISLAQAHFQKAVECLNLSGIPQVYLMDTSYESALLLKETLDRISLPAVARIPGQEYEKSGKGELPWRIPGTDIRIARVGMGKEQGKYLFTPETVKKLNDYYKKVKYLPYKRRGTEGFYNFYTRSPGTLYPPRWAKFLPEWSKMEVGEQTLWQWAGLVLIFLLTLSFFRYTVKTCKRQFHGTGSIFGSVMKFVPPISAVLASLGGSFLLDHVINITGPMLMLSLGALNVIRWLGLGWATFLMGDFLSELMISAPVGDSSSVDTSLVRTLNRLISLCLALAVLVRGADSMGISLIPFITGFGVVGLAFSLAAKPTVENVIGGITLFADRTVRVGEYCKFGDTMGEVMHIGLRSTRIRSRDRTIVSIPNGDFSQLQMTNLSRRDRIPFETILGLRYETTAEQLRAVEEDVKALIAGHSRVDTRYHSLEVFFSDFGDYSLNVKIRAYVKTASWDEFQTIREELLFGIMEILESRNVSLAFPSQTNYLERDDLPVPVSPVAMSGYTASDHM